MSGQIRIVGTTSYTSSPTGSSRGFLASDAICLHILRWPAETVALPAIRRHFVQLSVLTGGNVEVRQPDAGIEMTVPAAQRHALNTIGKLPLDGPA